MQVVGFNFTKVLAERLPSLKPRATINTNVEFTDLSKEEVEILKDQDVLKVSFNFLVTYTNADEKEKNEKSNKEEPLGKILFEGLILVSSTHEDIKSILKSWKKKDIPNQLKVPLFNLILKRCSAKALDLEEQLNLPPHIPIPQVSMKSKEE